jgi:FtsP/CotA-like multicopper oxidase with cupredoxin domain
MGGHTDYLGKVKGDGGRGPNGETPWPLRVGTEEEWTIVNRSTQPHPFHIHVSPFWVVDIVETEGDMEIKKNCQQEAAKKKYSVRERNPLDPRLDRWQDTLVLPPCGSVTVRHRVSDFTGLYVIHCHILQHEDRGMMINVLTVPNKETDPQWFFEQEMKNNQKINDEIAR